MLTLTKLILKAVKHNGFVSALIYGEMGVGKTSYALHVGSEVYGWNKVLNYLYFKPQEAIKAMRKALERGERIPLIIMDDVGYWLGKLTWWEPQKVAFMDFYNLIRSVCASVLFTCPTDEIPKTIKKKIFFRVAIKPLPRREAEEIYASLSEEKIREMVREGINPKLWNVARGYKLKTLPSFMQFVEAKFQDIYPLHYPIWVLEKYELKRREAVKEALEKVEKAFRKASRPGKQQLISYARKLLMEGYSRKQIVEKLMEAGVSKVTAYRYLKKAVSQSFS